MDRKREGALAEKGQGKTTGRRLEENEEAWRGKVGRNHGKYRYHVSNRNMDRPVSHQFVPRRCRHSSFMHDEVGQRTRAAAWMVCTTSLVTFHAVCALGAGRHETAARFTRPPPGPCPVNTMHTQQNTAR